MVDGRRGDGRGKRSRGAGEHTEVNVTETAATNLASNAVLVADTEILLFSVRRTVG